MRIGKVAALCGVSGQTIRNWEKAGLITPARRSPSNYRYWLPAEVEEIQSFAFRSFRKTQERLQR